MIAQFENIKLLQLTAGNGSVRQGSPYKVGVRFLLSETIKKLGFIFKDDLSNKQLQYTKLPKDYYNDEDEDNAQDSKPAAAKVARVSLDGKSTKAKKITKPEAKKSNNPITSYYGKKDAANSNDESELSWEGDVNDDKDCADDNRDKDVVNNGDYDDDESTRSPPFVHFNSFVICL